MTTRWRTMAWILAAALVVFFAWRFLRPMNIFVVDERFAWPVDTSQMLGPLGAADCAVCHRAFYEEWRTTIHSQAWTDPYFQVDWKFDGAQHSCRLCHTPLDRQQPHKVLGYRDRDKWEPVLAPNPGFDPQLQHEGVTCAACHLREGSIVGVLGTTGAPHPVRQLADPNEVCVRCHVVEGDRWDTFFRFPPCGTVAEIEATAGAPRDRQGAPDGAVSAGKSGELSAAGTRALGCVACHMPLVRRALVDGGEERAVRRHLWRGGHDPQMVKQALTVSLAEMQRQENGARRFRLTVINTGAAHFVPTGTPDRHLTVHMRLLDRADTTLTEKTHTIRRTVLWRPFIVDLRDSRLKRWEPRTFELEVPVGIGAVAVEAEVRYHLLDEGRRRRIGYDNTTPIDYAVFREQIDLGPGVEGADRGRAVPDVAPRR